MFILGIILAIAGAGSAIYGITENNNGLSQLSSLLSSGSVNPGTVWIIVGAIAVVVSIVLMIVGRKKPAAPAA